MPTYAVINKQTGAEVYRYSHDEPVEWVGMEFAEFDHVEQPIINADGSIEGQVIGRTLTRLEFLRRFTQAERIAIRAAAVQSPALNDFLELLDMAEEVHTDHPDTVSAITMLTAAGLLGPGRAAEILGGA